MTKFALVLLVVFVCVGVAEAFRCYDCVYFEGDAPANDDHDERCKEANEKNTNLSINCEDESYIPDGKNSGILIPIRKYLQRTPAAEKMLNGTRFQEGDSSVFSCVTVKMDGAMRGFNTTYSTRAIYRYCILLQYTTTPLPTKCYQSSNVEIIEEVEEEDLKCDKYLFYYSNAYTNDTSAEVCSCGTEYCNGERTSDAATTTPDSTKAGTSSLSVSSSVFVTVLVIMKNYFKNNFNL